MDARRSLLAVLAATLLVAPAVTHSQPYPGKPVRLLVGFAPGGLVDIPARIVAAKLGELWGTPVVVENRPGAGGSIAAEAAAKAPADGHTLVVCNTSYAVNPSFYKKLPYDPVRDFAPISMIGTTPNVLLVHPSSQMRNAADFLAHAKANPGKLSIGTSGVGSSQHLALEVLKSMTGTDIVHVPYKGGASALTDLIGGQLPAVVSGLTTVQTSIKAGKVRALGITSAKRSPQLPELPTIAESGVPGFEVTSWTGLCAPAALPRPLVARLNADMVRILGMPDTQRRLAEQGIDAAATTPEEFAMLIKSDVAKFAKAVKDAGITPE